MSSTSRPACDSATSRAVTTAPSLPTAVVISPTVCDDAGTSRRTVIENETLGTATNVLHLSFERQRGQVPASMLAAAVPNPA